ncbi:ABC transporter permease [Rugamonas sp. CCM 8940]|uniref:ABC transporter permease n=1 Tax=Rugamonas sp. CCM 8940 TaxID=2765359 RepID=UPI0018F577BB|nr:ABC transporter permease [Rugamonas sp. CCM 8940]MBJ7312513.1 ABC transporter permease [Rugamonas sp. CCM 8940]
MPLVLPLLRKVGVKATGWPARPNIVALLAALLGLLSLQWPFVVLRQNRVVADGDAFGLFALTGGWSGWGGWGWLVAAAWLALAGGALLAPGRRRALPLAVALSVAAAAGFAALSFGAAGLTADNEFARVGIAAGAWSGVAALYVAGFALYAEAPQLLPLPVLALAALACLAPFQHLGIVLEYREVAAVFQQELVRHLLLVLAALPFALLAGAAIGQLAARRPAYENLLLGVTGFLQTIPSIALFGLLLPLLSAYGRCLTLGGVLAFGAGLLLFAVAGRWLLRRRTSPVLALVHGVALALGLLLLLPVLGVSLYQLLDQLLANGAAAWADAQWSSPLATLGVRGLGSAPAIVALVLYGIWPVVLQTHTGLKSVPAAILEAAKGMGMSARQIFWRVELPLAAPFFIQGLRAALLLLIGLTTVAVLVNAGGLGYFLLRGTEQSVADLVLLGSLPVVALSVGADALTRLLAWVWLPQGVRA